MRKINFNKPLFLLDDRGRGCPAIVTKILYKDTKSLLLEVLFIDEQGNFFEDEFGKPRRAYIDRQNNEACGDQFSCYYLTNHSQYRYRKHNPPKIINKNNTKAIKKNKENTEI